jgi:prophage regulatory protein
MHLLTEAGYLRLPHIIGRQVTKNAPAIQPIIPVSRSTWWAGVKSGRYPQPVRTLGPRITVWRAEDIRALIERTSGDQPTAPLTPSTTAPREEAL